MAEYDASINYVRLHLDWIHANKTFKPKVGLDAVPCCGSIQKFDTYYDQQEHYYRELKDPNRWAWMCLRDDVKWKNGAREDINQQVNIMFGITNAVEYPKFFVTFNFDKNKFDSSKVLVDLGKLMIKDWIKTLHGAFENYTEKGEHPHLMLVISVDKYKNKIREKMITSPLAKYCGGANFIDIKRAQSYHNDYVSLDKDPKKQDYLDKDVLWRVEQNLPHQILK